MLRDIPSFPLPLCWLVFLAVSAWSGATLAHTGEITHAQAGDAAPLASLASVEAVQAEASPPPPLARTAGDDAAAPKKEEESCFANPLVWVGGGIAAVVLLVGGGIAAAMCGVPACGACTYACGYGAVGSVVGCALCSAGGPGGGFIALTGVSLAAVGGLAGAAVIASGDAPGLDSPTTLAGAGLIGAAAVGATALVGLGLTMALSEPSEEEAAPPGKEPKEQPLLLTHELGEAAVAY